LAGAAAFFTACFFAAGVFFAGLAVFARGFAALGREAFLVCAFDLADVFETFFFGELAINFGVALGSPGASGGLIKGICPAAQGEIYPRKTRKTRAKIYELALE
jgi:hypothetical protein